MKIPTLVAGTALIGIAIGFVVGNLTAGRDLLGKEGAAGNSSRTKSSRWTDGGAAGSATKKADSLVSGFASGREHGRMSASDALAIVKASGDFNWGGDPLDEARKNYEYQLMLSKLPLSEMESLIAMSKEAGVSIYRIRMIFNAYASRDLDKALAWATTQPDADSWKSVAIIATADRDPGRAMEMFQDVMLGGGASGYGANWEAAFSLAANSAKQGKVALLQFLDSVPSSGVGNYVSNVLSNLPKEDLPGFLEEIDRRVKDGKMESWTMTNVLQNLASNDPALARSLIEKMEPGAERAKREISFAGSLAQQGKTAEALELVKSALAQQPGKEKEVFLSEASNLMYSSPSLISQMVEALPPGVELTVEDVKNLGNRSGRSDPAALAKLLKSPDEQSAYLQDAIWYLGSRGTKPNETDFRLLEYRIQALGLTGSNAEAVQKQLAESRQKALGK